MAREQGGGSGADADVAVGEAADALYALPPDEFVSARDDAVRAARERGDQETARQLSALRRPTTSAWLVNMLYRHQREAVEELLAIGEQLTEAARQLSGPELQQLSAQRAQVVQVLVATARRLAAEAGATVSAATAYEVQTTLGAALADPEVAEQVRSGRLLRPASYAGFGPEPGVEAPRTPTAQPKQRAGSREPADGPQAAKRLARAEEQVANAQAALDDLERQLAERQEALSDALELCDRLAKDHQALSAQVAELEGRQRQAAERATTAERDASKAAARLEQASRRLDSAQQRLRQLQ